MLVDEWVGTDSVLGAKTVVVREMSAHGYLMDQLSASLPEESLQINEDDGVLRRCSVSSLRPGLVRNFACNTIRDGPSGFSAVRWSLNIADAQPGWPTV